nr:hypothetical protein [Myxococcota bacterium]
MKDRRRERAELGGAAGTSLELEEPFDGEIPSDDELPFLGRRLVLIERTSTDGAALADALRARGADVTVLDAEGARSASDLALDPDVVLVDREGVDGWAADALRSVRHGPRLRWAHVLEVRARELWLEPDIARLESTIRRALRADDAVTR